MSKLQKYWQSLLGKQTAPRIILTALLLLAVIPEFFIDHYAHFKQQGIAIDASFGFYIWYSFLACVVMIAGAKLISIFLKRRDTYYDE